MAFTLVIEAIDCPLYKGRTGRLDGGMLAGGQ